MSTLDESTTSMKSRRQALALAGVLTATVFTGVFAVAGVSHHPAGRTAKTAVVQMATPSAPRASTWADD
jgi:hypothetical protein